MRYGALKKFSTEDFRRRTGVLPSTFAAMVKLLKAEEKKKLARGGSPPDMKMENRLLLTLEYWREYRTYFHIASSYGVSESTAYRYIRWIENMLVKSKAFSLPGRKALLRSDMQFEVVMVDATESPCERPKKNRSAIIPARKNGIPRKSSSS